MFTIILVSLGICLIVYNGKIKRYEEIPPKDIYINGIKSFSFKKNNNTKEYNLSIFHFGFTGTPNFDCYSGTCVKEEYIEDKDEDDDDDDYFYNSKYNSLFFIKNNFTNYKYLTSMSNNIIDKNFTNDIKDFRYIYFDEIDYQCSRDCAINKNKYCLCPKKYFCRNGSCNYRTKIG